MIDFIVYALCDPRTHQVRYIGKSEIGLSRPFSNRGYGHNLTLSRWMSDLAATKQDYVVLVLAHAASVQQLAELETFWINLGVKSGWPLANKAGVEDPDWMPGEKRGLGPVVPGKKWDVRAWRRDPDVRNALKKARDGKNKP